MNMAKPTGPPSPPKKKKNGLSPKQVADMMREYKAGVSPAQLAEKYGVSSWTVQQIRKKMKIPTQRDRSMFRAVDDDTLEEARRLLDGDK